MRYDIFVGVPIRGSITLGISWYEVRADNYPSNDAYTEDVKAI